jgi:hypothetical protein
VSKLLSVVTDVFDLSGRGIVVIPGYPHDHPDRELRLLVGDTLEVRVPGREFVRTEIRGIEMGGPIGTRFTPLLLGLEMTKAMVPLGSELWIPDPEPEPLDG